MKKSLIRIISFIRKELKSFSKDKIMLIIFFIMPIVVIVSVKFAQNNVSFGTIIAMIDRDRSSGYRFNDTFSYLTVDALQGEWDYNESSNVFLNLSNGVINFTSSNAIQGECMYFRNAFNNISNLHNEILISSSETRIINASLTGFLALGLGMTIGNDVILACGVSFSYGNVTAINGSASKVVKSVDNNTLYLVEVLAFLKNYTYAVKINGSSEGVFDFGVNISTFNVYQSYLYPSSNLFENTNVTLDNVNVTIDATPSLDLSSDFSKYLEKETIVVYYSSESLAEDALRHDEIDAFIVIPDGFETNITQDLPVELKLTIDGSDMNDAPTIIGKVGNAIANFREAHDFFLDAIIIDDTSAYIGIIPTGPTWLALLIPPLIGLSFMGSSMITVSMSIVDDVPLQRLMLSPLKKSEVMIAKFLSYLLFAIIQITLFIGIWLGLLPFIGWHQAFIGSIIDCFFVMLVTSIFGMSIGFCISTIAQTKLQANQEFMATYIVFLTLWLIRVTSYDPVTQSEMALVGIIFKGMAFMEIVPHLFTLLFYSVIAFIVAFVIFTRKKTLV